MNLPKMLAEWRWSSELRSPLVLALIGLLAMQLLLALGLRLNAAPVTAFAPATPLLSFAANAVTRIRIDNAGGATAVTLQRNAAGNWVIPELSDFPAAPEKITQLLATLTQLKRPLPVATSAAALARFHVTADDYERRVILESQHGAVATLLLGDAAGFRRLFARPATDAAVYELPLALSDLSNRHEDWFDSNVLRVPLAELVRIESAEWTLVKNGADWRFDGNAEMVNQIKVKSLVTRLANLTYRNVLTTNALIDETQSPQQFKLTLANGSQRQYQIWHLKDSANYVLQDSAHSWRFQLAASDVDEVLALKELNIK
ncbi:hypothetical protein CKO09_01060 [Chromatium weissei]|nr:hypothetical protein [Chromatium weissei]